MASSSWSSKLETRLLALADGASKESIQSLAKWLGFNRKHAQAFATTLDSLLAKSTPGRQWMYLQIVHEVLVLEKDNPSKWDRLSEMRIVMGEIVVIPQLQRTIGDSALKDKIAPLIEEWDEHNVFGTPRLVGQMKRILSEEAPVQQPQTTAPLPTEDSNKSEPMVEPKKADEQVLPTNVVPPRKSSSEATGQPAELTDVKRTEEPEPKKVGKAKQQAKAPLKRAVSVEESTFDFEGSGIPFAKVDAREFLEPSKAIATLQIARDLRNDAAVQLSSRLSAVPEEIKQLCRDAEESGKPVELSAEQATKFAAMLDDDILDTDMDDALSNVKTFLSIVEQQQQARMQLIHLLIQSRCQFGSDEAAEAFYTVDDILEKLKERKQILSDAMDLEGLDFESESKKRSVDSEVPLEPLTWYKPGEPDAKRSRVE